MSVDLSTIKTGLWTWAKTEAGIPEAQVVWAEQNSPQPNTPYVTLRIASLVKVGDDYIPMPNASGAVKITGNRDFTLGIQGFGPGSLGILETLRGSLAKQSVKETFYAAKIALVNTEDVLNITELVETRFQERGSLDVFLRTYSEVTDNLGAIEKVEVTEEYYDPTGTLALEDTYVIDSTTP
jgi:hypothetical protein